MANELTELATPDGSSNKKKMDKGKLVMIGIGFITLVVTYLIYKRSQAANAATSTTSAANGVIDPTTGLPYAQEAAMNFGGQGASDYGSLATNLQSLIAQEGALTTALTNQQTTPVGSSVTPSYSDFLHVPDWATNAQLLAAGIQQYTELPGGGFVAANNNQSFNGQNVIMPGNSGGTFYLAPGVNSGAPVADSSGVFQGQATQTAQTVTKPATSAAA